MGLGEDKVTDPALLAQLTLVQWGWHTALHPWCVVIHDVDGDVGVPVRDYFYRAIVLSPLWRDGKGAVGLGWQRPHKYYCLCPPMTPGAEEQPLQLWLVGAC